MLDTLNLVSVGCLDGSNIVVVFNKPMSPSTANEFSNYLINDDETLAKGAVLQADGRTVIVSLSPPIQGAFKLGAYNMLDLPQLSGGDFVAYGTVIIESRVTG